MGRAYVPNSIESNQADLLLEERQWLISDRSATIWSNVLAIFLTFATARFFPILKRIFSIIWPPKPTATSVTSIQLVGQSVTPSLGTSSAPLSPNSGVAGNVASQNAPIAAPAPTHAVSGNRQHSSGFVPDFGDQNDTGSAGLHFLTNAVKITQPFAGLPTGERRQFRPLIYLRERYRRLRDNFREIALGMSLGVGLVLLQAGFMAVSIFSGLVVSDSVALSRSPYCALTVPDLANASAIVKDRWTKYSQDLEVESVEYAKRCYPASARSEECSYFYNQSIHFSVRHNDTCPFQGDICLFGPAGAFTMTTGIISPKTIGINTRLNYGFERTTTCSPLRMDNGRFIQRHIENGKDHFRYFFGGFDGTSNNQCGRDHPNCTWDLPIEITSKPMYRVL